MPGYAFMVDITQKQSSLRLNYSALPAEKLTEGVRRLGRLMEKKNWNLSRGSGYHPVGGGVSVSPAGSVKRFCLAAEASPGGPRRPAA